MTSAISSSLLSSLTSQRSASLFKKADVDGDNQLSASEFASIGQTQSTSSCNMTSSSSSSADGSDSMSDIVSSIEQLLSKLQNAVSGGTLIAAQDTSAQSGADNFIKKADTDGDGALSLSEFEAAAPAGADSSKSEAIFKTIDTDGDGKLSATELQADQDKRAASAGGVHGHGGPHGAGGGGGKDNEDDDSASTDPLDLNGDGIVSQDELSKAFATIKSQMSSFLLQQQESLAA